MDVNAIAVEEEIRFTLHLYLDEFVALGLDTGQMADDLCYNLIRARGEAVAALSSPIFIKRPNIKKRCEKLIDHLSSILVQHCPAAERGSLEG
jgi:hypothetical protein